MRTRTKLNICVFNSNWNDNNEINVGGWMAWFVEHQFKVMDECKRHSVSHSSHHDIITDNSVPSSLAQHYLQVEIRNINAACNWERSERGKNERCEWVNVNGEDDEIRKTQKSVQRNQNIKEVGRMKNQARCWFEPSKTGFPVCLVLIIQKIEVVGSGSAFTGLHRHFRWLLLIASHNILTKC